jgi:hypothetical protein
METLQGLVVLADAALVTLDAAFGLAHVSLPVFWADGLPAMVLVGASLGFVRAGRVWPWALGVGLALAAQLHGHWSDLSLVTLLGSLLLCGFAALVGSGTRHLWDSRHAGVAGAAADRLEGSDR